MTTKVVFISAQAAPFQAELAEAVNRIPHVDYSIVFCWHRNHRPAHWLKVEEKIAKHSVTPRSELTNLNVADWAVEQLCDEQPDLILVGAVRGPVLEAALRYKHKHSPSTKVGLWMEPPLRARGRIHRWARAFEYHYRLRKADFVLAIGDRAEEFYRKCNSNTQFVPYGEDLSECFACDLPKPCDRPLRFLFSGGLQKRHNFPVIMQSFCNLIDARGDNFEFVISGDGPEQAVIDRFIHKEPKLNGVIRYDRVFEDWNDRLRPFCDCDVFVYPTDHAGWGLVIPEAMAAGQLVISTQNAEAARYLVVHEDTGLIIEPNVEELTNSLIRCFDDRQWVSKVGIKARESAERGDAPNVAKQLLQAITPYMPAQPGRVARKAA